MLWGKFTGCLVIPELVPVTFLFSVIPVMNEALIYICVWPASRRNRSPLGTSG